jgi:hypothetical protein
MGRAEGVAMALAGNGRCPVCRAALWAPNSESIDHKTCPRCGAELWALAGSGGPLFFLRRRGESRLSFLAGLAGPLYGMSAAEVGIGLASADSLDLVEILMDVEEALRTGRR